MGLNLEEIKMCLDALPPDSSRHLRVEHTLQLLRQQRTKIDEHMAQLAGLRYEVERSLEIVTSKCLTCTAERCPENCPRFEHIL